MPVSDAAKSQTLRNIQLFARLSEAALSCLADVVVRRAYPAGALIVVEGEPCEAAYFVITGNVEVYRMSSQGRQQVLVRLGAGQAFNTVPLFQSDNTNHASVVALTDVTLYAALKDDFLRILRVCPDLSLAIMQDFADRLVHLTDLVEDLALHSVRARLARFLLQQADGTAVTQKWTQDEMAAHLGTVRDMIGRSLRALTDEGMIRMDRGRIVLVDRAALEIEAQN
jgi:CRP/FNR family cyclic AMP-dependent transcriptional regulator